VGVIKLSLVKSSINYRKSSSSFFVVVVVIVFIVVFDCVHCHVPIVVIVFIVVSLRNGDRQCVFVFLESVRNFFMDSIRHFNLLWVGPAFDVLIEQRGVFFDVV